MANNKTLVFVITYNAQDHIKGVLQRLPEEVWANPDAFCVMVSDDSSSDRTYDVCDKYLQESGKRFQLVRQAQNLKYGGHQKFGYRYAIKDEYAAVLLLHGDGQYAPELALQLVEPIINGSADVVLGSRMINRRGALKGGMPVYKFLANIVVTKIQNLLMGVKLSEFHTGYRAYSTSFLRQVPFEKNSNYFDFDTDILIQAIQTKQRILELPIPTFYGNEVCHVNGVKYVAKVLLACICSRLQKVPFFYQEKFDYRRHLTSASHNQR